MTIKSVDIELNHKINVTEATLALTALLSKSLLGQIDSFHAVDVEQPGMPKLGDGVNRARVLRITTKDLVDGDIERLTDTVRDKSDKLSLGTLTIAELTTLRLTQNSPWAIGEG